MEGLPEGEEGEVNMAEAIGWSCQTVAMAGKGVNVGDLQGDE